MATLSRRLLPTHCLLGMADPEGVRDGLVTGTFLF